MFPRRLLANIAVVAALLLPGVAVTLFLPGFATAQHLDRPVTVQDLMQSAARQSAVTLPAIPSANAADVKSVAVGLGSRPSTPDAALADAAAFGAPLDGASWTDLVSWVMAFAFLGLIMLRRTRSSRAL